MFVNIPKEGPFTIAIHESDTWNMYSNLALIILPMIEQFIEQNNGPAGGTPGSVIEHVCGDVFCDDEAELRRAEDEWTMRLVSIRKAFSLLSDDDVMCAPNKEQSQIIEEGLLNFAAHFTDLWN